MIEPRITLVVAASDSREAVGKLLDSPALRNDDRLEIIVVHAFPAVDFGHGIRSIAAEPGAGVHRLRALGFQASTTETVVFTEDFCRLKPGWVDAWIAAFAEHPELVAASGRVEPESTLSTTDLAVFLCEYAPFLGPLPVARSGRLAGNHFGLRKSSRFRFDELHEWVFQVHSGCVEAAVVVVDRQISLSRAILDRLRCGLDYGRRRGATSLPIRLILMRTLGPAILGSQVARLLATLSRKRRVQGAFIEALPAAIGLLAAWSVGEWLGWCLSRRQSVVAEWPQPEKVGPGEAKSTGPGGFERVGYKPEQRAA